MRALQTAAAAGEQQLAPKVNLQNMNGLQGYREAPLQGKAAFYFCSVCLLFWHLPI
jgi:hypothetical protein